MRLKHPSKEAEISFKRLAIACGMYSPKVLHASCQPLTYLKEETRKEYEDVCKRYLRKFSN